MKVLLIQPVPPQQHWPRGLFRSHWVPTGIASIAAVLQKAGCEVRLCVREQQLVSAGMDWAAADAALLDTLRAFGPEIVGLSLMTPHLGEAARIAQAVRRQLGDSAVIVAGGPHPSAMPGQTLDYCPQLDAVIVGEGERPMLEIARRGLAADIPGLVTRQTAGSPRPAPAEPMDLDDIGPPPYELLDMDYFAARSPWMIRWLPLRVTNIRTSRGCVGRCSFCAGHVAAGRGLRFRRVEGVIEQIARVATEYRLDAIHFEDDSLANNPARLVELCQAMRRAGLDRLKWDCCLRADQARPELLAEMKAAGCVQVEIGFESGSDAMLASLGKDSTLQQNRQAVLAVRDAGLRLFADILLGLPGERAADLQATESFIRWARPEVISASVLCPLPGTAIFDGLDEQRRRNIDWGSYAYLEEAGLAFNVSAMDDRQLARRFGRLRRRLLRPRSWMELLRDLDDFDQPLSARLRRRVRGFAMRHPISAVRLAW